MESGTTESRVLSLPLLDNPPFPRNVVKTAVCELRFPILSSLKDQSPPAAFVSALRKEFPHYEAGLNIGPNQAAPEPAHSFRSRDSHWTVSLRSSTLALETSSYASFEDLKQTLLRVLDSIVLLLDTDFFTRLGLRYVNVLPVGRADLAGWLNPHVMGCLAEPRLGQLARAWCEYVGLARAGRYNLRYGFPAEQNKEFILDIDFYREDLDTREVGDLMSALHDEAFAVFHWCLGANAVRFLQGA